MSSRACEERYWSVLSVCDLKWVVGERSCTDMCFFCVILQQCFSLFKVKPVQKLYMQYNEENGLNSSWRFLQAFIKSGH